MQRKTGPLPENWYELYYPLDPLEGLETETIEVSPGIKFIRTKKTSKQAEVNRHWGPAPFVRPPTFIDESDSLCPECFYTGEQPVEGGDGRRPVRLPNSTYSIAAKTVEQCYSELGKQSRASKESQMANLSCASTGSVSEPCQPDDNQQAWAGYLAHVRGLASTSECFSLGRSCAAAPAPPRATGARSKKSYTGRRR
jgi:hypothetical protein